MALGCYKSCSTSLGHFWLVNVFLFVRVGYCGTILQIERTIAMYAIEFLAIDFLAADSGVASQEKVSMIRKYHNHTLQTNLGSLVCC